MIRRILAAVLVVLGLVAIGLGIASATIWRPSGTVSATLPSDPAEPIVVVEPGVLGMVAEAVTVTARASADDAIVVALAPARDVDAWVGDAAHLRVTGMTSWTDLAVERVDGEPTVPNPAGSDLWRSSVTGTGEIAVDVVAEGDVAVLVATDGTRPAPGLTLTWVTPVTTPYLVPLLVLGGVLLVLGLGLFGYEAMVRRELHKRDQARESRRTADLTETTQIALVTESAAPARATAPAEPLLTRRQLRELERQRRQHDPRQAQDGPVVRSGGMAGAGIVPGVPDPERYRALRYVLDSALASSADQDDSRDAAIRAAGPARGSAIVPGVERRAPDEQVPADQEPVSWRALWGFNEEAQR